MKEKLKSFIEKVKNIIKNTKSKVKKFTKKTFKFIGKKISPITNFLKNKLIKLANFLHLPQFCKFTKLDKLYDKSKKVTKKHYKKFITLIIIPIIIFYYCQMFCNGKMLFEPGRMILNYVFIYLIIGFFYCIIGKVKVSLYITMILTFILGLVNHFITEFRGTPFVPWDIFSLNVALTVLPTFQFKLTKKFAIGVILFIIGLLYLRKIKIDSFRNGKLKKSYRVAVMILTVTFIFNFYLTNMISVFGLDENWDPKEEYHNNGLIASIFKQSRNLIISEPEGYDIVSITSLANKIEVPLIERKENDEMPNVIAIMNESFSELNVVGDFNTNEEYLPFYHSLKENTIKGNLHVSIFGATTPNSEWEFLTSNSMAYVPKRTVPYQQYVLRNSYSLASILKDQGYTTSAIHCYYPQGYNRNLAYPRLGFEKFLYMGTLKDLQFIREYPDDLSTYKNIIDIYENKEPGKKMFNFTLTMQNHGSYTDSSFESTIIAEDGQYPKLNQYLSLIKIADESFKYLIDYFSKQEEPTIIVMFGDHQPYVEDEFYEDLLSQRFEDINSKEATERKYITPYIIWANYDIDEEKYKDVTDISANYLASLLLDVANIQKTPYLQFLDELRAEIPIITGNGYIDKAGGYHDFSETNKYTQLIDNYHFLQFNNMFDNSNKLTSLFTVPEQARR